MWLCCCFRLDGRLFRTLMDLMEKLRRVATDIFRVAAAEILPLTACEQQGSLIEVGKGEICVE